MSQMKNPPWARGGADMSGGMQANSLMSQTMGAPGMFNMGTSQAMQNHALQNQALQSQALQNQFQQQVALQQQAQSIVQSQQAVLPQPGIALPTTLASPSMGTVSYPALKTQIQLQQATGQKQRVFTGTVTKLHDNFGFIDEDVFFQTTCVKGLMPKAGDRVLVEAQFNANMPFKWNATRIQVLPSQSPSQPDGRPGGKDSRFDSARPRPLMDEPIGRPRGRRDRFERDRPPRRREEREKRERDNKEKDKEKSVEKEKKANEEMGAAVKRSRSPKKSMSPRRSRSPVRRRPRIVPRYVVQVPKYNLCMREACVLSFKTRYSNMYVPSDFFNASFPWHESFPLTRPFQLGKHCTFHVLHKDVERLGVGQNTAVLDPPDADHLYSAKVMLISCPTLDDFYHRSCSLAQDPEGVREDFVHPTRLINFLVGVKGKNEPIAIGGPWSPSLDGENPTDDPQVLIKTAVRTCKALTGINLSQCTQWYRFAEVRYLRPEEMHKGKLVPARVETSVIFLPDVWSCHPTHLEWETQKMAYKKQLQKKLSQLEGKDDSQEEEEEGDISLGENRDPTHFSELDPKTMKIIDLRRELECRTLSSKGLKSQLIARLTKVLKTEEEKEAEDAANKPDTVEEEPEKEEPPEKEMTEEDEEKKKKQEEEKKKEEERKKAQLERRYTLPDKPNILVYPNATAKGGKFDCSVMSLSVLLDYRPEDNKEHSFEVSLFAELFNELLMRDFGFQIFKALCAAPEKPKEDDKKKKEKEKKKDEKSEEKEEDKEPAAKKKKTDEKEKKDSDKKEEKEEEKKDSKKEESKDDKEKEKKRERKKYITSEPNLLLSFIYFDQNHCGYLLDKDAEEIMHCIGLSQSRAQIKKLLAKVVSRDTLNYRKLTDKPEHEEPGDAEKPQPMEVDPDKLVSGNMDLVPKKKSSEEKTTPTKRKGPTKADGEPLTGMVMYNGAMLDIDSIIQRLEKSETSAVEMEKKLDTMNEEKEKAKKSLSQRDDQIKGQKDEIKQLKHKLTVQERITNSSESSNKKYLSALVQSQGLIKSLVTTVTTALGDMADITDGEEDDKKSVKKEKKEEETTE